MADVARLAGVSHQTVSRVLNGHPNVRPHTREKVLTAIRQLAYRPNAAARTLVTRRTHTLGVVSIDSTLYGPAMMLHGIERAAQNTYFVIVASLPVISKSSMLEAVDRLLGQAVEGIIVIAPLTSAVTALSHVPPEVPIVAVGCGTAAPLTSVAVDNAAGAASVTRYLLGLGHQTVHHVAGPSTWLDAQERVRGWRDTLREAGAPVPGVLAGDWTARSGYEIGLRLAADPGVTAVFCGNDNMALGLIRAMSECHRAVPHDVSVAGFDDVPDAGYFLPPLTTVRQEFGDLGRRAVDALVGRISGGPVGGPCIRVAADLVLRASTAGPRAAVSSNVRSSDAMPGEAVAHPMPGGTMARQRM